MTGVLQKEFLSDLSFCSLGFFIFCLFKRLFSQVSPFDFFIASSVRQLCKINNNNQKWQQKDNVTPLPPVSFAWTGSEYCNVM